MDLKKRPFRLAPNFFSQFLSVQNRTLQFKKNVILSSVSQVLSMFFQFLLVPVAMEYLSVIGYGVWVTLYGIITYFSIADFGIGNGLRQQLTVSVSKNSFDHARYLVSTAYGFIGLIMGLLIVLIFILDIFIAWGKLLNAPESMWVEVRQVFLIAIVFFAIKTFLGLFQIVLSSFQLVALNNLSGALSALITILLFLWVPKNDQALVLASLFVMLPPCVLLVIQSRIGFKSKKLRDVAPARQYFDFKYVRVIASMGLRFFIIQIVYVVIFLSDNLIISHSLGPEYVAEYNVAYRLFTAPLLFFSLLAAPLWAAFADAYTKFDFVWIRRAVAKLVRIWCFFVVGMVLLLIGSQAIYAFWLNDRIQVSFLLSSVMALYAIVHSGGMIFTTFVNAVGKIKMQTMLSVIVGAINIPLAFFLVQYLGSAGVMSATIICLTPPAILTFVQYKKIINLRAEGIWNA